MTTSEIITLCISCAALSLSLAALYFQFFHKRTSLNGRLIHIKHGRGDFDSELNYSLSNMGNQEILISDIEFFGGSSDLGREKSAYAVLKHECNDFPYVLKPGEIKLTKVSIKSSEIENVFVKGRRCFVMFEFTSTTGRQYEILHDVSKLEDYNNPEKKEMWKTFTLNDSTK